MKEITVQNLHEWKSTNKDYRLIDVRETYEYEVSNIGGKNVPLGQIMMEIESLQEGIPVVMQCRSGGRSAAAAEVITSKRPELEVYNLVGGIKAWKDAFDPNMEVA